MLQLLSISQSVSIVVGLLDSSEDIFLAVIDCVFRLLSRHLGFG